MVFETTIVLLSGILNRFRGGGFWSDKIPIKALWLVGPLMAALPLLVNGISILSIIFSVVFGIVYTIWAMPPWGRWYDLGRLPKDLDRDKSKYEIGIEIFTGLFVNDMNVRWFDRVAMFFRHLTMLVPCAVFYSLFFTSAYIIYLPFILSLLFVLLYEFAWQLNDKNRLDAPITIAEVLVGFVWGILILIA